MKISTLLIFFTVISSANTSAELYSSTPQHDTGYYTGTGSESISVVNYRDIAKKKALADLVSEIEIKVSKNSILNRMEDNDRYYEKYINEIRTHTEAWIERYELVDSWIENGIYSVRYRLDKSVFAQIRQSRHDKALTAAADFYKRGCTAQQTGLFNEALLMYLSGINTLEPYANEIFELKHNGTTMNLGIELLSSISNLFYALRIHPEKSSLLITPYTKSVEQTAVYASVDGTPMSGIQLSARLSQGDGKIILSGTTDTQGKTELQLSDVSAKPATKQITITPVFNNPLSSAAEMTRHLFTHLCKSVKPAVIPVITQNIELTAYISSSDSPDAPIYSRIKSFLSDNYFRLTDNKRQADLWIDIATDFNHNKVVKRTMGNLDDYSTTCRISVRELNATNSPVIIDVTVSDHHSLYPHDTDISTAKTNAQREIVQKVLSKLESKFNEAHINRKDTAARHQSDQNNFDSIPTDF